MTNSIIEGLIQSKCVKMGEFTLKNGELSKYYFDLKNLVSFPDLLKSIGDEIYKIIKQENFDIICGVPMGGLPLCTYISVTYNIPMIMVRDEIKSYGTSKIIEGTYNTTDKCLIIEDVITTGGSIDKVVKLLEKEVNVIGAVVILDRQQGHNCSIPVKSLITKTDIIRNRLKTITKIKKSNLCFSADVDDNEKILQILEEIGPYIVICKIHYDCMNSNDNIKKRLISLSIKHNFLIMEDRKFVDISYIVKRQYKQYSNWVDLVTVMGNVNPAVVSEISCALLVANMSNNNFDFTSQAIETSRLYPSNTIGFITQQRINEANMFCMTPGISLSSKVDGDQNYRTISDVDTDIIIVGRGIYKQDNYVEACKKYINNLNI